MKQAAIVGAGPAGTAAARQLRATGWDVTILEKEAEGGGLLRYGYPAERMPTSVSRRTIKRLQEDGVEFRFQTTLGKDITLESLLAGHDAVLLAIGAPVPNGLGIPGEDLPSITVAHDFLHRARSEEPPAVQGSVGVIGGGDTAVDTAVTALRLGAAAATVFIREAPAELTAQPREVDLARQAGVEFRFEHTPEQIEEVAGITKLSFSTPSGIATYDVEWALVAIGQRPDDWLARAGFTVNSDGTTNHPKLFIAGDARYGADMLASAIRDGRAAADLIIQKSQ